MKTFRNQNHRVNGRSISKVASEYDSLMISNRQEEKTLSVSTFSPNENQSLNDFIDKQASMIEDAELTKVASEGIDKEAFFAGGLDMFTKTRQLIANKLGVSEDVAHDLTSPVLNKTDAIVNHYGGDDFSVVEGIVSQMGTQLAETPNILGGDVTVTSMKPTGTKQLLEHIQQRLINEMGMGTFEVERYKHAVLKEAQDLTTMLRPHNKYEISDAIVNMMIERRDPRVVYGLKDSNILVQTLNSYLN